jgi:hypothetical protein
VSSTGLETDNQATSLLISVSSLKIQHTKRMMDTNPDLSIRANNSVMILKQKQRNSLQF